MKQTQKQKDDEAKKFMKWAIKRKLDVSVMSRVKIDREVHRLWAECLISRADFDLYRSLTKTGRRKLFSGCDKNGDE